MLICMCVCLIYSHLYFIYVCLSAYQLHIHFKGFVRHKRLGITDLDCNLGNYNYYCFLIGVRDRITITECGWTITCLKGQLF